MFLSTATWDGGPTGLGTNWHSAVNWANDTLPANGDDVIINVGAGVQYSAGDLALHSLTSAFPLSLLGGTLSVTATATVTAQVQLNGGAVGGAWTLPSLVASANPANALSTATINGDLSLIDDNAFLSVTGGLTVNGLVSMQGDGAVISFHGGVQTFAGNADVEFSGFTGLRTISADAGALLTLASTTTFMGERARITSGPGNGSVVNQGLIWANTENGTFRVDPSAFTNQGVLRSTSDGVLNIAAGAWTNGGTISINNATVCLGGTFQVAAGIGTFNRIGGAVTIDGTLMNSAGTLTLNAATGSWQFNGGQIIGGQVVLTGGASLTSFPLATGRIAQAVITGSLSWLTSNFAMEFDAVTLNGTLDFSGLSTLSIKNNLTLNGSITASGDETTIEWIGGSQSLSGNASIFLRHPDCYFWAMTPLTIPASVSITGYGRIYGDIASSALITSDTAARSLIIAKGTFANSGTITALSGAALFVGDTTQIATTFTNSGSVLGTGAASIAIGPTSSSGPIAFTNAGSIKVDGTAHLTVGTQFVFLPITVTNSGTIEAAGLSTFTVGTSLAQVNPVLNNAGGVIKATGKSVISIQTPVTTAQLGDLRAAGGTVRILGLVNNTGATLAQNALSGSWRISGGAITGGTLAFSGGASLNFDNNPANTLDGVTVQGPWSLSSAGARLQILHGLILSGTLTLSGADAVLVFNAGPQSLSGSGSIILAGVGGGQAISVDAGASVISSVAISGTAPGGQIRSGYVFGGSGSFSNSGSISGNLTVNTTSFTNSGTVEAAAGATLHIQGTVTNYAAGALSGGIWRASGSSTLDFVPGAITSNQATVILDGPKSAFAAIAALSSNSGTIQLSGDRSLYIPGSLTNTGILDLGSTSNLAVAGSFTQSALGTLKVHISSATAHSFLSASAAALGGALNITWQNYAPPVGARVPLVKSSSVTGTFAAVQTSGLAAGRIQTLAYTPTSVSAVISAPTLDHKRT